MASEFINLWETPRRHIMGGLYSRGEKYNVGYDTLNNKYYGQHNKNWLLKGIQTEIDKYTKQIADGGARKDPYGDTFGIWAGLRNPFIKYTETQLKETQARVDQLTKYYSGIDTNYEEFKDFDRSYKEYQQDWDNLFTRNYNNEIQRQKNIETERQNAITEARNKKVTNENMLNAAKATLNSGLTIDSGAIAKKQKNKETIGTGITSQADRLADSLLGGTGLGL